MPDIMLRGGSVVTPQGRTRADLAISDDRIRAVGPDLPWAGEVVQVDGLTLAPGLVDVHVHAAGGAWATTGSPADLRTMARALAADGVTGFLATSVTAPAADLHAIAAAAATVMADPGPGEARLLGVHLEGPHLSAEHAGAQPLEHLRPPDVAELAALLEHGSVRMVTLAPELAGAGAVIQQLVAANVTVALGHSGASYEQARAAVDLGARHFTHLFNAMPPLHHRAPGLAGLALDDTGSTVEVIADGVHLDPATVRLVWRARGADSVCLVSDAVGDTWGETTLSSDGAALRRPDGRLAGSATSLLGCLRNAVGWGIPLPDAVRMASTTPARAIDRSGDLGVLTPGALADLVALDEDLHVVEAWIGGRPVGRQP